MQSCAKSTGFCRDTRRPLAYLQRRPVPMKQLNPKIEDDNDAARKRGEMKPVDEKKARRDLQRRHKKEMRGAAKELRRCAMPSFHLSFHCPFTVFHCLSSWCVCVTLCV